MKQNDYNFNLLPKPVENNSNKRTAISKIRSPNLLLAIIKSISKNIDWIDFLLDQDIDIQYKDETGMLIDIEKEFAKTTRFSRNTILKGKLKNCLERQKQRIQNEQN